MCGHEFHSGSAHYDRDLKMIVYVLECDSCKEVVKEYLRQGYVPDPKFPKEEDGTAI